MVVGCVESLFVRKDGVLELLESKEDAFYRYHEEESISFDYKVIHKGKMVTKASTVCIPSLHMAIVHNGIVSGKCGVISSSGVFVKESLPPWVDIKQTQQLKNCAEKFCNLKSTEMGVDLVSSDVINVEGTLVVLSSCTDQAFSHFFFETFAKLYLLNSELILKDKNIKWMVNENSRDYQIEAIVSLGIPLTNIVRKRYKQNIKADKVILIESPSHNNLWSVKESLFFLKKFFKTISYWTNLKNFDGKIYIDRRDERSDVRKITNESSLVRCANDFGFKQFTFGKYALTEKYKLLQNASLIIGLYGGGMQLCFISDKLDSCIVLQSPFFYRGFIDYCAHIFKFDVINIMGLRDEHSEVISTNITDFQNQEFAIYENDFIHSLKIVLDRSTSKE